MCVPVEKPGPPEGSPVLAEKGAEDTPDGPAGREENSVGNAGTENEKGNAGTESEEGKLGNPEGNSEGIPRGTPKPVGNAGAPWALSALSICGTTMGVKPKPALEETPVLVVPTVEDVGSVRVVEMVSASMARPPRRISCARMAV